LRVKEIEIERERERERERGGEEERRMRWHREMWTWKTVLWTLALIPPRVTIFFPLFAVLRLSRAWYSNYVNTIVDLGVVTRGERIEEKVDGRGMRL
jgi:hypothetical protein